MGIFKKTEALTVSGPKPSLADQLLDTADQRETDKNSQLFLAEDLRARASDAEFRATVAAKEADALTQAATILQDAGVTL